MERKVIDVVNSANYEEIKRVIYNADNICPRCGTASRELIQAGFYTEEHCGMCADYINICLLSSCPVCGKMSLLEYPPVPETPINGTVDILMSVPAKYPNEQETTHFDDAISHLSPDFVKIYNQAEKAESNGCREISGMGYRKALEFLIKDYLFRVSPDDSDKIKSEPLSTSIKRLANPKLKTLAEKSAWIGNDECHYVKKHTDCDVSDMKRFIRAAVTYILSELVYEEAEKINSAHI